MLISMQWVMDRVGQVRRISGTRHRGLLASSASFKTYHCVVGFEITRINRAEDKL